MPATGSGRILLVTEGSVTVQSSEEELELARGESALLTAAERATVAGPATVFVGAPGVS